MDYRIKAYNKKKKINDDDNNIEDTNLGVCNIVYYDEHGLHYQLKWIWGNHSRPSWFLSKILIPHQDSLVWFENILQFLFYFIVVIVVVGIGLQRIWALSERIVMFKKIVSLSNKQCFSDDYVEIKVKSGTIC